MDTTQLAALGGIIGFFLPLLIAVIARCSWPEWARATLALLVCLAAGFVTSLASGDWSLTNLAVSVGAVLVFAWNAFSRFWNKVGAIDKINSLTGG